MKVLLKYFYIFIWAYTFLPHSKNMLPWYIKCIKPHVQCTVFQALFTVTVKENTNKKEQHKE